MTAVQRQPAGVCFGKLPFAAPAGPTQGGNQMTFMGTQRRDPMEHYQAAMESENWQDKMAEALLGILLTLDQINGRYQEASRGL